jgi:hypothetical protein
MKTLIVITATLVAGGWFLPIPSFSPRGSVFSCSKASAQEDWKREFDDVCSKTQDTMTFSTEELKSLIARCEALTPRIQRLDEPLRKITTKRLKMCRDLYAYTLEAREAEKEKR